MLPWKEIHTVLLDMDGTLLDLHFDNHFWMEFLPQKLAERDGISVEKSKQYIHNEYQKVSGTIQWYCFDFWSEKLNIDIVQAKREIEHLISMRDDTIPFLKALHDSGREVVLVTNSHPAGLTLKVERTLLDQHIDTLISTHEFGVSKESQELWHQLQARLGFSGANTLFVDDSLPILAAAETFGVKHLLAVRNPDSKKAIRDISEYPAITNYRDLVPDILANPVD